jgi:Uma2 family endonuclease
MSAMTLLPIRPEGWTVDDLDELPEDDGLGYELVDGALLVTPPPRPRHDIAATELLVLLRQAAGPAWRVLGTPGVYLDELNYREPDVAVCRPSVIDQARIVPREVLLVAEVMSPGSVSTDRLVKPAQYAAAGIAHYWRLELDPLVLFTSALTGAGYVLTGRHTDEVHLTDPFDVRFRLADLLA